VSATKTVSTTKTVCVVGLGKIGLPLALQFAASGFSVIGADIDPRVVADVMAGREPFPGEPELADRLRAARDDGSFTATTETAEAVAKSSVVVIVVPLIVDEESRPDFSMLDAATASVGGGLQPGTLVAYETTVPIGTTRNRLAPALSRASGLEIGRDLAVVFSPERVYSGRIFADLRKYPKLVGGIDRDSEAKAVDFYSRALQFDDRSDLARENGVWSLGSAEAAEFAKLAETTYRNVNIALANEFGVYAESIGVDVRDVIEAANSQPFSHIHTPGVAVGGHCIPVYPRLYTSTDTEARLPVLSHQVNTRMPGHVAGLLDGLLPGGVGRRRVAVLGATYRGNVKETAFSGVFPLVEHLERLGADVVVHDTLLDDDELRSFGLHPAQLGEPVDAAVLQADHDRYYELVVDDLPGIAAIVDGRGVLDPAYWVERGVAFRRIGDGSTG